MDTLASTATMPLAMRAARYVAYGWSLLPLVPRGKQPHRDLLEALYGDSRIGHLREAPALSVEVEWWFLNWEDINVGIFPGGRSGLVVCDVDDLDVLDLDLLTPSVSSGRDNGGRHVYFRSDDEIPTEKMPWGHVNPAYIVAPGSIHPSGKTYEWLPGRSPDELPLLEFAEAVDLIGYAL